MCGRRSTPHSDVLTGNSMANEIAGLGGDHTIYGAGGDDTLDAGAGSLNKIEGQAGTDTCGATSSGLFVVGWPKTCELPL